MANVDGVWNLGRRTGGKRVVLGGDGYRKRGVLDQTLTPVAAGVRGQVQQPMITEAMISGIIIMEPINDGVSPQKAEP